MNIIAYFSNDGVPATGLSATVDVWETDGTQVVTAQAMTEVAGGFYVYDFTTYSASVDYCIRADGSATLANSDRYMFGSSVENELSETDSAQLQRIETLTTMNLATKS